MDNNKKYNHINLPLHKNQEIIVKSLKLSPLAKVSLRAYEKIVDLSHDARDRASLLSIYAAFSSHAQGRFMMSFAKLDRIREITGLCHTTFTKNLTRLFSAELLSRSQADNPYTPLVRQAKNHPIKSFSRLAKRLSPPAALQPHAVYLPHAVKKLEKFVLIPTALFRLLKEAHLTHGSYVLSVHLLMKNKKGIEHYKKFSAQAVNRRCLASELHISVTTLQLAVCLLAVTKIWDQQKLDTIITKTHMTNGRIIYIYHIPYTSDQLKHLVIRLHPQ